MTMYDLRLAERVDERAENATRWECEFLDSILKRLRRGGELTQKQREILVRIEEERVP